MEARAKRLTWAHAEWLAHESERAAAHDAARAAELAGMALRLSGLVPVPEDWRPFLLGFCHAFAGNARRVGGRLPEAEAAFVQSDALWAQGKVEAWPLDASRLLDLKASLHMYQGRFEEALSLLGNALKELTPGQGAERLVLKEARALELLGEYEQALTRLGYAESLIDPQKEPRLFLVLRFNTGVNLCHLDRHAKAEALMTEVRDRATALGNRLDLVRALWLKGRIDAGLGRRQEAVAALEQVQSEFTAREIAYDSALVSLELALFWLEEGRAAEVQELARRMNWIFKSQKVHKAALAALTLFHEAALQEAATVGLTCRVLRFLERAREAPGLRFER